MWEDEERGGGGAGGEVGCVVGLAVTTPGATLAVCCPRRIRRLRCGVGGGRAAEANKKENFRIITDIFVGFIGFGATGMNHGWFVGHKDELWFFFFPSKIMFYGCLYVDSSYYYI